MLTEKQLERNKEAVRAHTREKENRIRIAASLSRDTPPSDICRIIGISQRTLKRYAKDPRWSQFGGAELPRYFGKSGRPRDLENEKQLILEAYRLKGQGMKWVQIAEHLKLTIGKLEYLRTKYPV